MICYTFKVIKAVVFDYGGVVSKNLQLQSEILNLAQELRNHGIEAAILSNMPKPIAWFIERRGYFSKFQPVVVSCWVGCSKPSPEIYQILIKKLEVQPEECVFIDNKLKNLLPARELGIKTILAVDTNQVVNDVRGLVDFGPGIGSKQMKLA